MRLIAMRKVKKKTIGQIAQRRLMVWRSLFASCGAAASRQSAARRRPSAQQHMHTAEAQSGSGTAAAKLSQNCRPAPKWATIVNDQLFPMPEQRVGVRVVREQVGISKDDALVRDHNSPHDVVIPDNGVVDLADGNVFYTRPQCEIEPRPICEEAAKLAYTVDDRWEIVLKPGQTGRTIRDLFKLIDDVDLLRDYKSPHDEVVGNDDAADFREGPVFITKRAVRYCINIEGKEYPWNEPTITTAQIRKLGNLPADQAVVCEDAEGRERTLREDEVVKLDPCCQFGRAPKYKRG
jgi:hypothetical protein